MALQDLTPQLRTRLSRLERLVGLFVGVATLLMLCGLAFYIYRVAERKGWFLRKLPYFTYVRSGAGLKVGDPVRLMGFEAGEITEVEALPPDFYYGNVFVAFKIKEPYDGYLFDDSRARVAARDLLGNRFVEVTKGTNSVLTYLFHELRQVNGSEIIARAGDASLVLGQNLRDASNNLIAPVFTKLTPDLARKIAVAGPATVLLIDTSKKTKAPTSLWDYQQGHYRPLAREGEKGYFLPPDEAADVAERIEKLANTVETALPGIFDMTNQINRVLTRAAGAAERAEQLLAGAQPLLTNVTLITAHLTNGNGSLGEWLIPPALNMQLTQTLASANAAITNAGTLLAHADAEVGELSASIGLSLINLANLTSNLHAQVEANTNILSSVSRLVVDTDDMVQGLKRHWFLRSAFKTKATNAPANPPPRRAVSPKFSK